LEKFRGRDATENFFLNHSQTAIKKYQAMPSSTPPPSVVDVPPSKVVVEFRKLRQKYMDEGYFKRNIFGEAADFLQPLVLGALGAYFSRWSFPLGLLFMAAGVLQAIFAAHDLLHYPDMPSYLAGGIVSLAFAGYSPSWWTHKHARHHAFTNQKPEDIDLTITQPFVYLWSPSPKEFDHPLRPYQHIYYPFAYCMIVIGWKIKTLKWIFVHKKWLELPVFLFHFYWMSFLPFKLLLLAHWIAGFAFGMCASGNHQGEEIMEKDSYNFVQDQFNTTRDLDTGYFMAWVSGGLNYQVIHHLFALMPRYYYRSATPILAKFAKENGIEYKHSSVVEASRLNYITVKKGTQKYRAD